MAADFGASGLWYWNGGSWTQLSGANFGIPGRREYRRDRAAEIIGDFGAIELWVWSGGAWTRLSGVNVFAAGNTDGTEPEDLIGDFGATGGCGSNQRCLDPAQRRERG